MPASEARILANQANAKLSTGPKTPEGKAISRANALKHGLTGAGIVLPNEDAAEVERKLAAYQEEMKPTSEPGRDLARRAAVCSVRMDRSVSRETAALSERVRQAEADFVAPEGLDEATVAQLRAEAGARAMFDPSKEAILARQYEAAAERGFFRALKELRQLEKAAPVAPSVANDEMLEATLASLFELQKKADAIECRQAKRAQSPSSKPQNRIEPGYLEKIDDIFDVPISIGKRR
jgi:hypothetical protein